MKVKKLDQDAIVPLYQNLHDSGTDLRAYIPSGLLLQPGCRVLVKTGIIIYLPLGIQGMIWPALASSHGVMVLNSPGIVTNGEEVCVLLYNSGDSIYEIKHHDCIAQLVLTTVCTQLIQVVESDKGEGDIFVRMV